MLLALDRATSKKKKDRKETGMNISKPMLAECNSDSEPEQEGGQDVKKKKNFGKIRIR